MGIWIPGLLARRGAASGIGYRLLKTARQYQRPAGIFKEGTTLWQGLRQAIAAERKDVFLKTARDGAIGGAGGFVVGSGIRKITSTATPEINLLANFGDLKWETPNFEKNLIHGNSTKHGQVIIHPANGVMSNWLTGAKDKVITKDLLDGPDPIGEYKVFYKEGGNGKTHSFLSKGSRLPSLMEYLQNVPKPTGITPDKWLLDDLAHPGHFK